MATAAAADRGLIEGFRGVGVSANGETDERSAPGVGPYYLERHGKHNTRCFTLCAQLRYPHPTRR
jgi:hypothetical protein